jgi:hypothetical protein
MEPIGGSLVARSHVVNSINPGLLARSWADRFSGPMADPDGNEFCIAGG